MAAFTLRRILQMIPLLLGVTIITFVVINAAGSPVSSLQFDPKVKPADRERLKESLGLNEPVYKRYFIWIGNVAQGDLGDSLVNHQPVTKRILAVLPNTLVLSISSLVFSLVVAIPIGILAAIKRNSLFDRIANLGAVAGFAVPTVWLSLLLIILFSVKFSSWGLPSLPVGGVTDLRDPGGFPDRIRHLILPVLALSLPQIAEWVVYVRSSMLEVIRQDYMRTAQAKGLETRTVMLRHGFRNAALPLVTLIGLSFPGLFGGALIVENIFAYNGMGRLTYDAVVKNDYTVIMGTTLFFAFLIMLGNLIADLLYAVVDPRIRTD
jgi:peptide/nickel transport system permease protein